MHANQPQYLIETKLILFYLNVELDISATTHAIDGSDEKNQNEKNDIELNICHLYIDSEYTHGPVISPCISINGVITLDRNFFFFCSSVYGSFFSRSV